MQNPSQYMYYIDLVIIQDAKVALYWKILHFLPNFFFYSLEHKEYCKETFQRKKEKLPI